MSGPKVLGGVAVGVALGTALGFYVLAPNVEGGPAGVDSGVQEQLDDTRGQLDAASAGLDADDGVLDSLAPAAVRDALKGRSVLVVTTPDADAGTVTAQQGLLRAAGAEDAGTVRLSASAVAQDGADAVKSLAASALPSGTRLSEDRRDPGFHLGQVLGAALRSGGAAAGEDADTPDGSDNSDNPDAPAPAEEAGADAGAAREASPADRDLVLGSLDKGGFLDGGIPELTSADVVLVVVGDATGYAGTFAADLAAGLDATTGGAVLAGDWGAARDGGALAVLRGNRADTETVSSVDNADRSAGRITVVRALAAQLDGKVGSYGAAESAVAPTL